MRKLLLLIAFVAISYNVWAWGQTGHRVVGQIAENHLTRKAKKNIAKVLGDETLAEVSTWMDFIKSDKQFDHMKPWHYATIPDGKTYAEAGTPKEGDIIVTIDRLVKELKSKQFTDGGEAVALKCLVHLIGDIHQPLHVGKGDDRGANAISVKYFWKKSNLHRVWDSGIIDEQQYSYTEYTDWIDHASKMEVSTWQQDNVLTWAMESVSYRPAIYDLPNSKKISYKYNYKHLEIVNKRLLQGGIRLAGILNEIYG